jgi:Replication regulatory protein RepB
MSQTTNAIISASQIASAFRQRTGKMITADRSEIFSSRDDTTATRIMMFIRDGEVHSIAEISDITGVRQNLIYRNLNKWKLAGRIPDYPGWRVLRESHGQYRATCDNGTESGRCK